MISLLSRIRRSFELHATHVHMDRKALEFMSSNVEGPIAIIAHEPLRLSPEAYRDKLTSAIEVSHLPVDYQALFLEVVVDDSSDFETALEVRGVVRHGYQILEVHGPVVPNTIASVLLHIRDVTGLMPHIYFRWTEGNPVTNLLRFLCLRRRRDRPGHPRGAARSRTGRHQAALGPRRLSAAGIPCPEPAGPAPFTTARNSSPCGRLPRPLRRRQDPPSGR